MIDEDGLFDILRKTAPQPPESPEPVEEEAEAEEEVAAPPAEVPRPMGVNMGVKREGGALSSTSTGSAAGAGSRSSAGAGASSSASGSKAPGAPAPAPARMPREATGDEAPPLWAEKYRPTAKAHLVGNADQARRSAGLSDGMLIGSLIRRSYLLGSLIAC